MNTDPQTLLGRYKLVKVLGRGAMGVVYEATDTRLSRTVAIKTVLRSFLADESTSADYTARFEREAQAAARLNHPNIVAVFDFGEQDDVSFIVMEFVRGRELGQALAEGEKFSLEEAVRIMGELLDALAYAHEHGIVHRDVKPANVMIDSLGRVKLTDFGVARLADSNQDRTLPGTMVGTPSYMAPEQILGLAVGSRTDIFGAGVVLYQFLTGTRPFVGGGPFGVQRKIVHDEPVPPSQVNPNVPAGFDAIVSRALAKQPEDRYESAAAFAADLRRMSRASQPAARNASLDLDLDCTVVATPGPVAPAATAGTVPPPPQAGGPTIAPPLSQMPAPDASPTVTPTVSVPAPTKGVPTTLPPPAPPKALKLWLGAVAVAGAAVGGLWLLARPAPVAGPVALPVTPSASAPQAAAPQVLPAASAPTSVTKPAGVARAATSVQASAAEMRSPAARTTSPAPAALPQATPARAAPAAPPARSPGARTTSPDPRCNDLLLRMQLGDLLTPEQTTFFHTRCAR